MATVRKGSARLRAGEHVGDLRHHVGHQEQHDGDRDDRDDGRVQRGAQQLGLQGLALFQVVGQALQHQAQVAALLAGADHGDVDVGELARKAAPAPCRTASRR